MMYPKTSHWGKLLDAAAAPMTACLAELRRSFEDSGAGPGEAMPYGLVLSDICDALGLIGQDREKVLGRRGLAYLAGWEATPVGLCEESMSAQTTVRALQAG